MSPCALCTTFSHLFELASAARVLVSNVTRPGLFLMDNNHQLALIWSHLTAQTWDNPTKGLGSWKREFLFDGGKKISASYIWSLLRKHLTGLWLLLMKKCGKVKSLWCSFTEFWVFVISEPCGHLYAGSFWKCCPHFNYFSSCPLNLNTFKMKIKAFFLHLLGIISVMLRPGYLGL